MDLWDILISCEMRYLFNVKFECGICCKTLVYLILLFMNGAIGILCARLMWMNVPVLRINDHLLDLKNNKSMQLMNVGSIVLMV